MYPPSVDQVRPADEVRPSRAIGIRATFELIAVSCRAGREQLGHERGVSGRLDALLQNLVATLPVFGEDRAGVEP